MCRIVLWRHALRELARDQGRIPAAPARTDDDHDEAQRHNRPFTPPRPLQAMRWPSRAIVAAVAKP